MHFNVWLFQFRFKTQDKRWNIELFIAAPQIILPESFHEMNASMILVDLGNLSFVTKSGTAKTSQNTQKDDNMDVEGDGDGEWRPCHTVQFCCNLQRNSTPGRCKNDKYKFLSQFADMF